VLEWQSVGRKPLLDPNLSHINFCAVVEQQIKNGVVISLFWVAFFDLGSAAFVGCVLESTGKYGEVPESEKEYA